MNPPLAAKPSSEDFAPRAVARAVRNEALQHPLTIVPGAGAVGLAFWGAVMGLHPVTLVAMLGLVFVSGVSCAYQYLIRGEDHATAYVQGLRALRREHEAQAVLDLASDCQRADFAEGATKVRSLAAALGAFEGRVAAAQSGEAIAHLGRDAFREGLGTVERALTAYEARRQLDQRRNDRGVTAGDAGRNGTDGAIDPELRERQRAIDTKRAERRRELDDLVAELLVRASEIEAAIEAAAIDLVADAGPEAAPIDGGGAARLGMALEAARRVQERARGLGRTPEPGDEQYLETGRRSFETKEETHGR